MQLQALSTISILGLLPARAWASDVARPNPFKVNLSAGVSHMRDLIERTHLPANEVNMGVGTSLGITLDALKSLKSQWLTSFDWEAEQESINE